MTGFGRASVEAGERRLRVEIRSVNHRGLDLKIRGAELGRLLRRRDRRARCAAAVERGAVTVHVRDESAGGVGRRRRGAGARGVTPCSSGCGRS